MASSIKFEVVQDNTDKTIDEMKLACHRAMEIIGLNAEKYAKALCPVGTPESTGKKGYVGGTLRNSITHISDENSVTIGTNVFYAPYVELGTGPFFQAPPEWEEFHVPTPKGKGTGGMKPRPFLRDSIEEHLPEFESIIKNELGG